MISRFRFANPFRLTRSDPGTSAALPPPTCCTSARSDTANVLTIARRRRRRMRALFQQSAQGSDQKLRQRSWRATGAYHLPAFNLTLPPNASFHSGSFASKPPWFFWPGKKFLAQCASGPSDNNYPIFRLSERILTLFRARTSKRLPISSQLQILRHYYTLLRRHSTLPTSRMHSQLSTRASRSPSHFRRGCSKRPGLIYLVPPGHLIS